MSGHNRSDTSLILEGEYFHLSKSLWFSCQFLQTSYVSAHENNSLKPYSIGDENFLSASISDESGWWDSITLWFDSVSKDFQETGDKIKGKFESIKKSYEIVGAYVKKKGVLTGEFIPNPSFRR